MELIQKLKIKLIPEIKKYWKQFLFLGIISQTLLIFLLQTVVFVCKKTPLGNSWVFITDAVTKVLMVVFLILFCIAYMECEIKAKKEQYMSEWDVLETQMGEYTCSDSYMEYRALAERRDDWEFAAEDYRDNLEGAE